MTDERALDTSGRPAPRTYVELHEVPVAFLLVLMGPCIQINLHVQRTVLGVHVKKTDSDCEALVQCTVQTLKKRTTSSMTSQHLAYVARSNRRRSVALALQAQSIIPVRP